ncbi:uncharacterized protein B0H64DRAFT_319257 [Chaetomium fimeti]|uniref:Methyltransferase domain-containing protein n=1 Tax=Chaetomium fimeti TaxID=1854472 RepID=A0AAE0HIL2_9PEZI|nr:hypothetical protein B0H64DRAFT_319257 [Chaetomium fimeti]
MEFLSGYAAAKAPYLTYEVEGSPHSRSKPTRSNSTSAPATKKRSRIPGHARTNSASTSSSGGGRTEHQAPPPHSSAGWLQQSSAGADGDSGAAAAAAGAVVTSTGLGDRADTIPEHQHHHPAARRNSTRERDRMHSSLKYFQDKQLPATPRLNTADATAKLFGAGSNSEPASARTPASATTATAGHTFGNPGAVVAAVAFPDRRAQHGGMLPYTEAGPGRGPGNGGARAESISSVSGATTTSNRTVYSSEHTSDSAYQQRPFVVRNGRTYLADPSLPYPLPVDLEELHRQNLKTILLMQLYGRPICAPAFANKPPARILEVGCGTGFWSTMCYKHYEARGQHKDISFTGIDIVALPPNASSGEPAADTRPDKAMNWRFVQHDIRKLPFPFANNSFDFLMIKDMTLVTPTHMQQAYIEEYIRILTPGGTIEIWETDNLVRMLRPHVPDCATTSGPTEADDFDLTTPSPSTTTTSLSDPYLNHNHPPTDSTNPTNGNSTTEKDEIGGAYVITTNTPLSTPLNNFLVEYNGWASRALDARALCAVPCTVIGPLLLQEAEVLAGLGSRRLAVPLSEIRWEREGVGGVVTKDGKSYIETKARRGAGGGVSPSGGSVKDGGGGGGGARGLEPAGAALRRTALVTVVQMIQAMEPMLREASGKSQDEWDAWLGKMMNDLVRENGTSWGECLEVGAWWARKR